MGAHANNTMTTAELQKVVRELQREVETLKGRHENFTAKFAWYHLDEQRREFAIILRFDTKNRTADLLCLSQYVNGRTHIVTERKMVNREPEWPKAKCWEPMDPPDMPTVTKIFDKIAKKAAAKQELETEAAEDAERPKSALTARP